MAEFAVQCLGFPVNAIRSLLRIGIRAHRDPLRWSRARWFVCSWVWAIGSMLIGASLLMFGDRIILAKGAWAIYGRVFGPHGLHLDGAVLLGISLVLVVGLAPALFGEREPRHLLRRAHTALGCYYLWCVLLFCLSPLVPEGSFSWLGVVTFTMLATIPIVLSLAPPPQLIHRGETHLVRAALDEGVRPDVAARIAERFYDGLHGDV